MRLHHVNIVGTDVAGLDDFYRRALGLSPMPAPSLIEIPGYSIREGDSFVNPASFLSAGDPDLLQLHLCAPDQHLGQRYGQYVNPVAHGHVAFRCDDIAAVKRRLDEQGIPYSDYGEWAMRGWYQIFLVDPVGTVVEVHQVIS